MNEDKCLVCGKEYSFAWTDHHGIAQCRFCGAPYRVFHYENNKRIERPPALLLDSDGVEETKRFYLDTGHKISAVGMGLSFPGGYDVASQSDIEAWDAWKGNKGAER